MMNDYPLVDIPVAASSSHGVPLDSLGYQETYRSIVHALDGDVESRRRADEALVQRGALYHGAPVPWSVVPKVFSRSDVSYLAWIAEMMGRIMDKVTEAYVADPLVRAFFSFDPRVEAACRAPVPYERPIPIARVDIFLDEETGDFQFCELNTDGSAGMLATSEITQVNLETEAGRLFARDHAVSVFDIYGACADAILDAYRSAGGSAEHPVVAAIDYRESVNAPEIARFVDVFSELGASLRFADIRDLAYEDGVLRDAVGPIDCVWRRLVISDLEGRSSPGVDAFLACANEGRVPMVGAFRTWPCATKTVFALFHDELAERILDAEELAFVRPHVPATYMLDAQSDLSRFTQRERWIAKPRDGFNGKGVQAGSECTDAEWLDVLQEMARSGGTVQAYAPQFYTMNADGSVADGVKREEPHSNMEGLYLFNGRFAGVFTRCGTTAVIGALTGRLNMGCLVVDE